MYICYFYGAFRKVCWNYNSTLEIIFFRIHNTIPLQELVTTVVKTFLPTKWGDFDMIAFGNSDDDPQPHLVLIHPQIDLNSTVPVRIHSECMTGDLFGSERCDCGEQLDHALTYIQAHRGILIYLRQEGRGIGLINKLKAYNLQDQGLDTIEANVHLGFDADERDFSIAVSMLESLRVRSIDLITNNPEKMKIFDGTAIILHDRISLVIAPKENNKFYLKVKHDKMGHLYDLD